MTAHSPTPSARDAQALNLQGTPPELIDAIENAVRGAYNQHGICAFAMPREAALVHECGHAIIGTHEGLSIRSVTIESRVVPLLGTAWGGWCMDNGGTWTSGPNTTAQQDLSRARIVI